VRTFSSFLYHHTQFCFLSLLPSFLFVLHVEEEEEEFKEDNCKEEEKEDKSLKDEH